MLVSTPSILLAARPLFAFYSCFVGLTTSDIEDRHHAERSELDFQAQGPMDTLMLCNWRVKPRAAAV
jgi:hypothetical protein